MVKKIVGKIAETIQEPELAQAENSTGDRESVDTNGLGTPPASNRGKLMLDATVADQMIKFPTDAGRLNQTRLETERIIDLLYPQSDLPTKTGTYRRTARKEYLAWARKKNNPQQQLRKIVSRQLGYLRRNINIINLL